jgi:hypothetical protein
MSKVLLRNEYDEASQMFDHASERYEQACQQFPELHEEVKRAENEVSCADVTLEYACMNGLDTTEPENKLIFAKRNLQDAKFNMNEKVPHEYENKLYAQLRYTTARRAYYQ